MYRIALCDDEALELEKTEKLLIDYKRKHPDCDFAVSQFTNVDALLGEMEEEESFDLLFLDVYLPGKNGIEGARKLRAQGANCHIVFLTSSKEHAIEAFEVNAVQYLIKPVAQSRFFAAIEKVLEDVEKAKRKYITLRLEGKLQRVALQDIISVESHGSYKYLALVDGTEPRVRMSLSDLYKLMGSPSGFAKVGIAYIVNLEHVDSMSTKEMVLDNSRKIGIPRGTYSSLRKQYFEFYCSGRDMT